MDHELVTITEDGGTLLTFEDAVTLTELLQNYINTEQGKLILAEMGRKFGLELKEDFIITNGKIQKNCPDCSGCHQGRCILGCMKTPGFDLCYWDEALERIVGSGLVTHELAHLWFEQAYVHTMDFESEEFFEKSEEFAQYVEKNFTQSLAFCTECNDFVLNLNVLSKKFPNVWDHPFVASVVAGVAFGIGSFIATLAIGLVANNWEELEKQS